MSEEECGVDLHPNHLVFATPFVAVQVPFNWPMAVVLSALIAGVTCVQVFA